MWDKLVLYLLSECTYRQKVQMQRFWSMHVPVIGADMSGMVCGQDTGLLIRIPQAHLWEQSVAVFIQPGLEQVFRDCLELVERVLCAHFLIMRTHERLRSDVYRPADLLEIAHREVLGSTLNLGDSARAQLHELCELPLAEIVQPPEALDVVCQELQCVEPVHMS